MIPPGERAPCEFAPNAAGGMNLSVSPRGAPDLGRSDSIFALLPMNVDAFFRDKGCRLPAPPHPKRGNDQMRKSRASRRDEEEKGPRIHSFMDRIPVSRRSGAANEVTYSSAPQATGCSLPTVETAKSESPGHPGGMQGISRWLSAAIPPDSRPPPIFPRTPAGVQDTSVPVGPGVPHPCRGAKKTGRTRFPVVSLRSTTG